MKTIKVGGEPWFKNAPFHEVKMLGIKHLGIAAAKFEGKQPEHFKRALVRQVFLKEHQYGEEFEIVEPTNPFGAAPKRRSTATSELKGEYRFVKNGLRAPEGDIRYEMMECLERHTSFEEACADWDKQAGIRTKFKSTGSLEFDFISQTHWAIKRGWIVVV